MEVGCRVECVMGMSENVSSHPEINSWQEV